MPTTGTISMLPNLFIINNLFDGSDNKSLLHNGGPLIDLLIKYYPSGFPRDVNTHVTVDSRLIDTPNYDMVLSKDDVVSITHTPKAPAVAWLATYVGAELAAAIIGSAIIAAVNLAINLIFFPNKTTNTKGRVEFKTYDLYGSSNIPRIGDPIPCLYGSTVCYPDQAMQPYIIYEGNDAYYYGLMVLGHGEYRIDDILLENTPTDQFDSKDLAVTVIPYSDHQGKYGYIDNTYGIQQDVVTSVEVTDISMQRTLNGVVSIFVDESNGDKFRVLASASPGGLPDGFEVGSSIIAFGTGSSTINNGTYTITNIELQYVGPIPAAYFITTSPALKQDTQGSTYELTGGTPDTGYRGWYITTSGNKVVKQLQVDLLWPNGLVRYQDDGDEEPYGDLQWQIEYQAVDINDEPYGPITTITETLNRASRKTYRATYFYNVANGRYRVRMKRLTPEDTNNKEVSSFYWTGLKSVCVNSDDMDVYGDVTLVLVRGKANSSISGAIFDKFRVKSTRILPTLASDFLVKAPTTNPVDAFCDVILAKYGAAGSMADLKIDRLKQTGTDWANTPGYNAILKNRSTVWETLNSVAAVNAGIPATYYRECYIHQDGPQAISSMLFTPENMVANTFVCVYTLRSGSDFDSTIINYNNPISWNNELVLYPTTGERPLSSVLVGCSNKQWAAGYAKYLQVKTKERRKQITFSTLLEGLIPNPGARISVSQPALELGESCRVDRRISATQVVVDRSLGTVGTVWGVYRDLYGGMVGPVQISVAPDKRTLTVPAEWALYSDYDGVEATHIAIGTMQEFLGAFVIQSITPNDDGTTEIIALNYSEAQYTDTLDLPGWNYTLPAIVQHTPGGTPWQPTL